MTISLKCHDTPFERLPFFYGNCSLTNLMAANKGFHCNIIDAYSTHIDDILQIFALLL